jgi:predicted RNase H-like nuclease (RuvC/YqgF family)
MSVQAQKGNKILRISEDAIERYLGMGYNIIGADGAVLKKAVPADNNQLKLEYSQNIKEIENLKTELASLKTQNSLLKQENIRLSNELEKVLDTEEEPKKTRKRKSQNTETEVETE